MSSVCPIRCGAAAACLAFASLGIAAGDGALTAPEIRGQAIYRTGVSPSGQSITAIVGGGTEVPANLVPCEGCHGRDGRGRPEAGVIPANISWEELTRPYEVSTASGRRRTAYDDSLAIRAITMGIDASGNRLDASMPQFAMSRSDAMDLVAYLKRISTDRDPGIGDDSVRIGVLLPPDNALIGQRAAIQRALSAYFEDWNGRGGAYHRRVELVFGDLPREPGQAASAYAAFLARESVFALLSSFVAGAESEIVRLLAQQKVPLIGAATLLPQVEDNPTVFFLDSGLPGQVEALAEHALKEYPAVRSKPVVIASGDALSQAGAGALRAKLSGSRWAGLEQLPAPRDAAEADRLTRRLAAREVRVVFSLMPGGELGTLIASSRRSAWKPVFLIPGALGVPDAATLRSLAGPVALALPFSSGDVTQDARAEWNRLADAHPLGTQHIAAQFSALCEARILAEGLKRAGRDLSRESLLESFDGLYDFSCGFRQPVSFGPGRRIGIERVHVRILDPKTGELTDADSGVAPPRRTDRQ